MSGDVLKTIRKRNLDECRSLWANQIVLIVNAQMCVGYHMNIKYVIVTNYES